MGPRDAAADSRASDSTQGLSPSYSRDLQWMSPDLWSPGCGPQGVAPGLWSSGCGLQTCGPQGVVSRVWPPGLESPGCGLQEATLFSSFFM